MAYCLNLCFYFISLDPNNHRAVESMQAIGRSSGTSNSKVDTGFFMNCEENSGNANAPALSDQEGDNDSDSEPWIEASRVGQNLFE